MPDAQKIIPLPIAEVMLDDALDAPLDYRVPPELNEKARAGSRVKVPVRNSQREGTIVGFKESSPFAKLLEIGEVLSDKTHVTEELFLLARWISEYYFTPLRKVLKTILPSSVRGKAKAKEQLWIQPALSLNELSSLCNQLRRSHPAQAASPRLQDPSNPQRDFSPRLLRKNPKFAKHHRSADQEEDLTLPKIADRSLFSHRRRVFPHNTKEIK